MTTELAGQTAPITGAGRGTGHALAGREPRRRPARDGCPPGGGGVGRVPVIASSHRGRDGVPAAPGLDPDSARWLQALAGRRHKNSSQRLTGSPDSRGGNMPANHVSVVLMHGAWADGSSWSKVIGPLKADGMKVVAALLPLTSLADDIAARLGSGTARWPSSAGRPRVRRCRHRRDARPKGSLAGLHRGACARGRRDR